MLAPLVHKSFCNNLIISQVVCFTEQYSSQVQRRSQNRDAARARAVTYLDLSKLGEEGETPASEEMWLTLDEEDPNAKGFLSTSSEEDCALGWATVQTSFAPCT